MLRFLVALWFIGISGVGVAGDAETRPTEADPPVQEAPRKDGGTVEDIETILTQPLGQDEYVESERCLSRYSFHSVDIIDDRHVLFRGRRGKSWLNTLRRRCIGLRRHDIPTFEYRSGNQLCNLDDFVGVQQGFGGFNRTSASCVLGDFQPVTDEQVALIKATVESRKGRRGKRKKDPGEQPSDADGGDREGPPDDQASEGG